MILLRMLIDIDCITMLWCAKSHALRALERTIKGSQSVIRKEPHKDSETVIGQTKGLRGGVYL